MYNPSRFNRDQDEAAIAQILRDNPLATVISPDMVSHLPLIEERRGSDTYLVGHLAKANPHWQLLKKGTVTAVFHGPNAYITPRWYTKNDVPTWNYAVVHMRGTVRTLEGHDDIVSALKKLTAQVETKTGWEFWLPPDLAARLTTAIVAFEIKVEHVDAKFKLSQNRSPEDREGVVSGLLNERRDQDSRLIAELMKS